MTLPRGELFKIYETLKKCINRENEYREIAKLGISALMQQENQCQELRLELSRKQEQLEQCIQELEKCQQLFLEMHLEVQKLYSQWQDEQQLQVQPQKTPTMIETPLIHSHNAQPDQQTTKIFVEQSTQTELIDQLDQSTQCQISENVDKSEQVHQATQCQFSENLNKAAEYMHQQPLEQPNQQFQLKTEHLQQLSQPQQPERQKSFTELGNPQQLQELPQCNSKQQQFSKNQQNLQQSGHQYEPAIRASAPSYTKLTPAVQQFFVQKLLHQSQQLKTQNRFDILPIEECRANLQVIERDSYGRSSSQQPIQGDEPKQKFSKQQRSQQYVKRTYNNNFAKNSWKRENSNGSTIFSNKTKIRKVNSNNHYSYALQHRKWLEQQQWDRNSLNSPKKNIYREFQRNESEDNSAKTWSSNKFKQKSYMAEQTYAIVKIIAQWLHTQSPGAHQKSSYRDILSKKFKVFI